MTSINRAFTLIEMLIVIAITAITTATIGFTYITEARVNKSLEAQTETLEQLLLLEATWKRDVRECTIRREADSTTDSVHLMVRTSGQSPEHRIYSLAKTRDKIAVIRIRESAEGRELSRQMMAMVDSAEFGLTTSPSLCRLRVSARSGFASNHSTQKRTFLACPAEVIP